MPQSRGKMNAVFSYIAAYVSITVLNSYWEVRKDFK